MPNKIGRPKKPVDRSRWLDDEGRRPTPEYNAWRNMRQRCTVPTHKLWHRYGGRGVTVCDRWLTSFENFLADMGPRPDGGSLDRIDNDGNYEPGNCRWATSHVQARNRGSNAVYEIDGVKKCLVDWAKHFGINQSTLRDRVVCCGIPIEEAVQIPVGQSLLGVKTSKRKWRCGRKEIVPC